MLEARAGWRRPQEHEDLLAKKRVLGHQLGARARGVECRGARQCGDRARGPQQGLDGLANSVDAVHHDNGHGTDPTGQHAISSCAWGLPSFAPWACAASWYGEQAAAVCDQKPNLAGGCGR